MTTFTSLCRRAPALALPLLLAACAVSQQGNRTIVGFDQDELTAVRLQDFPLGTAKGVLRRTANNQYQIKLYDRMKLIDLGRIDNPRVVGAVRAPGYDLVIVHAPTRTCPYAHRLYELQGMKVGMYDINNTPGKCDQPVELATDGRSWMAHQTGGRRDSLVWFWDQGKLVSMIDPVQNDSRSRQAGSAAPSAAPAPASAPAAAGTGRRPAARFESGDTASAATTAAANVAGSETAPTTPASGAKPRVAATAPYQPAPAAKRIDAGRYTKLPSNGVTEIAPTKVTLRDAE